DFARGGEALDAFDEENRPVAATPLVEYGDSWLGPIAAFALVAFFFVTGERSDNRWFALGSADAARMHGGEWWRALTALTLHADLAHVASNAFAAALLFDAVA